MLFHIVSCKFTLCWASPLCVAVVVAAAEGHWSLSQSLFRLPPRTLDTHQLKLAVITPVKSVPTGGARNKPFFSRARRSACDARAPRLGRAGIFFLCAWQMSHPVVRLGAVAATSHLYADESAIAASMPYTPGVLICASCWPPLMPRLSLRAGRMDSMMLAVVLLATSVRSLLFTTYTIPAVEICWHSALHWSCSFRRLRRDDEYVRNTRPS